MDSWLAIGIFMLGAGVGALLTLIFHCGLRDSAMHRLTHAGKLGVPLSCIASRGEASTQEAR